MMGTIELAGACFSYDGVTNVFADLNCTIASDEVFCILGPNGIGKSTLLNGIMNIHPLSAGRILVDGRDVGAYSPPELARKIAYIPQTYQMAFPFKVMDLVLMGRTPHLNDMNRPSREDYNKAMEAIAILGLEPFVDRACTQLSGGQLQLVMLARAIAQEAEFLVMDEPTSHLDYGKTMETLRLIRRMHARGMGVVFTTHSPDHAFLVCDKVAIMDGGTFSHIGSPRDVVSADLLSRIYQTKVDILEYADGAGRVCVPDPNEIGSW